MVCYMCFSTLQNTSESLQSGPKVVDRLSLFSSIHLFCPLWDRIVIPNSCLKIEFPLPTPCLNVVLNSGFRPCQYSVDQHWKWGVGKISDNYAWVIQHFRPWLSEENAKKDHLIPLFSLQTHTKAGTDTKLGRYDIQMLMNVYVQFE